MQRITATDTIELELSLVGMLHPAEPDVGLTDSYVDDAEIEGVYASRFMRRYDLLEGCDLKSPDIQRLLSNLAEVTNATLTLASDGEVA